MENFADTFKAKLWLLVVDKIVIGAIIAIALFVYDQHKTEDARTHQALQDRKQELREQRQTELQLQFERSRLVKEFLPVIQDPKVDLVTRAYVLRSAVLTESLDAEAAFEIGQDFLRAGLSASHYKRIVSATLPSGIGAFAKRGVQISKEWHDSLGGFPNFDTLFNPVSGVEHLPQDAAFITEGRLLRDVLYENLNALDGCTCPELSVGEQIPAHLFGLFVLLQTSEVRKATELSLRPEKALKLLGMVFRLWQPETDTEAAAYLEKEFSGAAVSGAHLRRRSVLLEIARVSSSPAFTRLLAKIAVGQLPEDDAEAKDNSSVYWLRWNAAEALLLAEAGAIDAVPTIVEYLETFREALASAEDHDQRDAVSNKYQSGKIVRVLVSVLRNVSTDESKRTLQGILDQGEDRLRYFPFLKADLEYALGLRS